MSHEVTEFEIWLQTKNDLVIDKKFVVHGIPRSPKKTSISTNA
jgi:hypothetical protein